MWLKTAFVTNEIQILETVSDTTFRSSIIRSGQNPVKIDNLKQAEVIQLGDIPKPSYGASLVRVPAMDRDDLKVAVKVGGSVLANHGATDIDFLFSGKSLWEEESTNEVHILKFNILKRVFIWEKINLPHIEPSAFHSAIVMGPYLYIFGGINIASKERHRIMPRRINLTDWSLSTVHVEGLPAESRLAGAAVVTGHKHAYLVGGYQQQHAQENDKPTDRIIQIAFEKGK